MALVTWEGKPVVRWVARELQRARHNGWSGQLLSGYRTDAEQIAAARRYAAALGRTVASVYPNGPLASNHCRKAWPRGAADVTDPRGLVRALDGPGRPWRWRRLQWSVTHGLNDPAHFSRNGH